MSLDVLEYVGDEGEEDESITEGDGAVEEDKWWEGEI